jgi:4-amino-4-deoxy-L-arabinose transferase-like glycosyltransferase
VRATEQRSTAGALPLALGALLAIGVAMRVCNALHYPWAWGFDATENWQYVERLLGSWALPAPDAGWATSHPPLFYYLAAAAVRALGRPEPSAAARAIQLGNALVGLAGVAAAALLVRRLAPRSIVRSALAASLLLFLPAHVLMSAMLSEEVLASALATAALVGACATLLRSEEPHRGLLPQLATGVAAGLALLTKLSAAVLLPAIVGGYLLDGWRAGALRAACWRGAVVAGVALAVGGWYYARNLIEYGYLYPRNLPIHGIMQTMPPGSRSFGDYVRFPLATFGDPQLLAPDLLQSVWGSTYATVWFDGHRHFLPREDTTVRRVGTALLLFALVPTAAFAVGLARGARRLLRGAGSVDGPLVLVTALVLAAYAAFTWSNPWFAAVKGTYLLGLALPYAVYASEVLDDWLGRRGRRARALGAALLVLAALVATTFSFGLVFEKSEAPGLPWRSDLRTPPDAGIAAEPGL